MMERFSPLKTTQDRFIYTRKGKHITVISLMLILFIAGGYIYYSNVFSASQTVDSSPTQTSIAQRGDIIVSASGTGTLVAQTDASFGFESSGQVAGFYVKVGDQIENKQVPARLDNTHAQMKHD